jgi:hypothetical protein
LWLGQALRQACTPRPGRFILSAPFAQIINIRTSAIRIVCLMFVCSHRDRAQRASVEARGHPQNRSLVAAQRCCANLVRSDGPIPSRPKAQPLQETSRQPSRKRAMQTGIVGVDTPSTHREANSPYSCDNSRIAGETGLCPNSRRSREMCNASRKGISNMEKRRQSRGRTCGLIASVC